jgi:hypothetical protein
VRDLAWIHDRLPKSLPCLTKVPLVYWDSASHYFKSTHAVSPKRVAPVSGALLHFKFLQDFHQRAIEESDRGEYYNKAVEYRTYAEALNRSPAMSLMYPGSVRYERTSQLVELGLIQDSADWIQARRPNS